jgi:CheY-like chemotaxis protein
VLPDPQFPGNSVIFVVDDDREDQQILHEYFEDAGLGTRVRYFDNGEQVIAFLEPLTDTSTLPSLIVLDLNMPILNGTQTLRMLKRDARLKQIPVIILSTSENDEEKRKCLSYGAIDYLVKPMSYDDGRGIVERFSSYL